MSSCHHFCHHSRSSCHHVIILVDHSRSSCHHVIIFVTTVGHHVIILDHNRSSQTAPSKKTTKQRTFNQVPEAIIFQICSKFVKIQQKYPLPYIVARISPFSASVSSSYLNLKHCLCTFTCSPSPSAARLFTSLSSSASSYTPSALSCGRWQYRNVISYTKGSFGQKHWATSPAGVI